ncbi:hypothetical protein J7E79_17920 [Bacillus sp. ISL-40]|uniref:hypothetical protein n=1 Tax=unclassified Bacillus (in: firmicutes) TaxID=185979 RepID=UPI001BE651B7|nr:MULTISPECIES: hypothetical protein [unclassified Bacillus (in: firmicutes)]MBT2699263.1 hypothetical protein [Bacillus sp. ISL-40]MBT2723469.1 hypothetical protein [Bacillus sp. ISL-46]MBT2739877.1 hypothetical protein [Bacillus sp. ISL-77]
MKINEYYRDTAHLNLNGSIAALIPAVMIVAGNLSIIKNKEIMILTIPFLIYSLICFQIYLFRIRQSISIDRNMANSKRIGESLFETRHLLVLFLNTNSPRLLLYFPDGHLAGMIKRFHNQGLKKLRITKIYALYNLDNDAIGYFKVNGKKIEVFDHKRHYLGCFEKRKLDWRTNKKELLDSKGRFIGAVEGSYTFMDEQVINKNDLPDGRLRRGWMPVEWSPLFPEPNTPVLSLRETLSEEDKLLRMSFIVNEYFIER